MKQADLCMLDAWKRVAEADIERTTFESKVIAYYIEFHRRRAHDEQELYPLLCEEDALAGGILRSDIKAALHSYLDNSVTRSADRGALMYADGISLARSVSAIDQRDNNVDVLKDPLVWEYMLNYASLIDGLTQWIAEHPDHACAGRLRAMHRSMTRFHLEDLARFGGESADRAERVFQRLFSSSIGSAVSTAIESPDDAERSLDIMRETAFLRFADGAPGPTISRLIALFAARTQSLAIEASEPRSRIEAEGGSEDLASSFMKTSIQYWALPQKDSYLDGYWNRLEVAVDPTTTLFHRTASVTGGSVIGTRTDRIFAGIILAGELLYHKDSCGFKTTMRSVENWSQFKPFIWELTEESSSARQEAFGKAMGGQYFQCDLSHTCRLSSECGAHRGVRLDPSKVYVAEYPAGYRSSRLLAEHTRLSGTLGSAMQWAAEHPDEARIIAEATTRIVKAVGGALAESYRLARAEAQNSTPSARPAVPPPIARAPVTTDSHVRVAPVHVDRRECPRGEPSRLEEITSTGRRGYKFECPHGGSGWVWWSNDKDWVGDSNFAALLPATGHRKDPRDAARWECGCRD
jgi:hypothetical protein